MMTELSAEQFQLASWARRVMRDEKGEPSAVLLDVAYWRELCPFLTVTEHSERTPCSAPFLQPQETIFSSLSGAAGFWL